MQNTRWEASWVEPGGQERVYCFSGPQNRAIARIDLQLKLIDAGEPVPKKFELDEDTIELSAIREELRHAATKYTATVYQQPGYRRLR